MSNCEKPDFRAENPECPCRRKGCPRHGKCADCRRHHENGRYPPQCEKKTPAKKKP